MSDREAMWPSLERVRTEHLHFLENIQESASLQSAAAQLTAFLQRGQRAGVLLDRAEERRVCQGILDYWASQLCALGQSAAGTRLQPFDQVQVQALVALAEQFYTELPDEEQQCAKQLLLAVVPVTEGSAAQRTIRPTAASWRAAQESKHGAAVIEKLTQADLIFCGPQDGSGEPGAMLSYDVLIRAWPRLAGWIEQERTGQRHRAELFQAARKWAEHGRKAAMLWPAPLIAEARQLPDLPTDVALFLAESDHAAAEFGRIKAAAKAAQRLRWIVLLLGVVLLMAVSGGVKIYASYRSERKLREQLENKEQDLDQQRRRALGQQSLLIAQQEGRGQEALQVALDAIQPWPSMIPRPPEAVRSVFASLEAAKAASILPHPQEVTLLTLDPTGHRLFTATQDHAWLWDTDTGKAIAELKQPDGKIHIAKFSHDGKELFTGGNRLATWDASKGTLLRSMEQGIRPGPIEVMAVSPTELRVAVATMHPSQDEKTQVRILSMEHDAPEPISLDDFDGGITDMAFSADGIRLLTGGKDGRARVFDAHTGHFLQQNDLKLRVVSVGFSPDQHPFAERMDGKIYSLDAGINNPSLELVPSVESGERPALLLKQSWATKDSWGPWLEKRILKMLKIVTSADQKRLVGLNPDHSVVIFRREMSSARQRFARKPTAQTTAEEITHVAVSNDGIYSLTTTRQDSVVLWDTKTGALLRQEQLPQEIHTVTFTPDGAAFVVLSGGTIYLRSTTTHQLLWPPRDLEIGPLTGGAASCAKSGQMLFGGSYGARLVDIATGGLGPIMKDRKDIDAVACSENAKTIASSAEGVLRLWNNDGQPIHEWSLPNDLYITALAFSERGQEIAAGDSGGHLRIYQTDASHHQRELSPAHRGKIQAIAFAGADFGSTGEVLMSVGTDSLLRVWDLKSKETLVSLTLGEQIPISIPVRASAISALGTHIITLPIHSHFAEFHVIPTITQAIQEACVIVKFDDPNVKFCSTIDNASQKGDNR